MPATRPHPSGCAARCPAAGSLCEALNRAVEIVCLEFSLQGDRIPIRGDNCSAVRLVWEREKASLLRSVGGGGRKQRRAASVLKSCSRLFDNPCPPCDKKAANAARSDWYQVTGTFRGGHVGSRTRWSDDPISTLKQAVRELVGTDWAADIRRGEAIPDQQGCLQKKRVDGGTFAVGYEESLIRPANHVRVGCAKTKGKVRVVTMQGARVKRVLSPVHDVLYSYLSRFGWLVRGELN